MARAAARRSLAAFGSSMALGSSTGATSGAAAFFDALAGLAACGAGCGGWACPLVARHTPNASSSAYFRDLSRIIMAPIIMPPDAQCNHRRRQATSMGSCRMPTCGICDAGALGTVNITEPIVLKEMLWHVHQVL